MKRPQSDPVFTKTIATLLPVNEYFGRNKFSILTGILPKSCNQRLKTLVKKEFLERKGEDWKDFRWRMTEEMQQAMKEFGSESAEVPESTAAETADLILRNAKFI